MKPKTKATIAKDLQKLSDKMLDVATDMDYFGGFDAVMVQRSKQMVELAAYVQWWAQDLKAAL